MILTFKSDKQNDGFYALMGQYFASLTVAKELERQVYNKPNTDWYIFVQCSEYKKELELLVSGFVYVHDAELLVSGFVSVHDGGKGYFIDNLYVIPDMRNCNIATELVEFVVDSYTDKPLTCIANHPAALKIFNRFGFEEYGHRGKFKKLIKH